MIRVTARVEIADIPLGAEGDSPNSLLWNDALEVRSHATCPEVVVLRIDGKCYAVAAKDIIAAVQNASNVGER